MAFLCNAFNDPSNPWYYVIGVVFLLVLFGALAAYIVLTGKKNKPTDEQPKTDGDADKAEEPAQSTAESPEQTDEPKQE